MEYELTPEQELLRTTVYEFCNREISPESVREHDRDHKAPRELYGKIAKQGWLGINIPEEHRGGGAGEGCSR